MQGNLMNLDFIKPRLSEKDTPQEMFRKLMNYVSELEEGLRYAMSNLGAGNFNATELKSVQQDATADVEKQLESVIKTISAMSGTVGRLQNGLSELGTKIQEQASETEERLQELQVLAETVDALCITVTDEGISIGSDGMRLDLLGDVHISGGEEE